MIQTLSKIGKYEVVDVLGRGGMGVVYKATDPGIGRLVAIKMMTVSFAENPDLLKRFYREAQSTGLLQHPNIVIIHELGDQNGSPYLVMEYLEGEGLDKIITARRPLSLVQKLEIIIQVCNALNYAHGRGVVHRDIKPANVVVLKEGGIKLVDFGIARISGDALTRTGQVVGTIHYMSPEQINAQGVDGRSDIFSAGVMLFQLLTNTLPFEAPDTASTLLKIIHEAPPPLAGFMPDCPPELQEVVSRALAKDRDERYQTADEFALDLITVRESRKRLLVDKQMTDAQSAVERGELAKAKEILLEVLKTDTQNIPAKQALQQVQQRLQKQQRGEQIRQLRGLADEAIAQKLHDDALGYLDQALALDKTNAELSGLREQVQQARTRKLKLEEALRRADSAQQTDDLESARRAAVEALEIDPENTRANAVHGALVKELIERTRQDKLQRLLSEATRQISSRKFTAAFEVLKQAEALDPAAPEVQALINLANSGKEQESRRRELERVSREIEDALTHDDLANACTKAEEALQKFPADPALLKLRNMAEKQREASEKKRFLDEQMQQARKLLDVGRAAEALEVLGAASKRAPGDTRIQSLLALVRESAEREKQEARKQQFIQSAKESLRSRQYEGAIRVLEEALAEIPESAEIQDLLQFARDEAAHSARRERIEAAAGEAQRLMADEDYERAIALLESTLEQTPDEELRLVLAEARRHVEERTKRLGSVLTRAQRLLESRKPEDSVTLLESQPKWLAKSEPFIQMLERARAEAERFRKTREAVQNARAALTQDDFATADNILVQCSTTLGDSPELQAAVAEVRSKRTASAKAALTKVIRDGKMLLTARQYNAAQQFLSQSTALAAQAPDELRQQYETLVRDAAAGAARQQQAAAPSDTQVGGSVSPTVVAGSPAATAVLQRPQTPAAPAPAAAATAVTPIARPAVREPAVVPSPASVVVEPKRRHTTAIVITAAVVIVMASLGAYVGWLSRPSPKVNDSYIAINAVPWGTVKTISSLDGKTVIKVDQPTPLRLTVPAGEYKVKLAGPDGREQEQQVKTAASVPASCTIVFEAIDVDKILSTH